MSVFKLVMAPSEIEDAIRNWAKEKHGLCVKTIHFTMQPSRDALANYYGPAPRNIPHVEFTIDGLSTPHTTNKK